MIAIAHISDLHFGRHIPEVVNGLQQSLHTLQPDLVVISGDLTQRATVKEFRAARAFVDGLRWPSLTIPGNHDLPAVNVLQRLVDPWRRWRDHFSLQLEPSHAAGEVVVLGLNTARRAGPSLDWSRGRVNREQLRLIAARLEDVSDSCLRLVVAHHPFWLPPEYAYRGIVGRRDEALDALAGAGIDMILSGHVHLVYRKVLSGVIISHAGTSTSDRLQPGHPNSFNIIRGDRSRIEFTQMTWNRGAFSPSQLSEFRLERDGWRLHRETVPELSRAKA